MAVFTKGNVLKKYAGFLLGWISSFLAATFTEEYLYSVFVNVFTLEVVENFEKLIDAVDKEDVSGQDKRHLVETRLEQLKDSLSDSSKEALESAGIYMVRSLIEFLVNKKQKE